MIKKIIKKIKSTKLVDRDKYDNLLKCLDEAICNNHGLRKVCQCRECKWLFTVDRKETCKNPQSDNLNEAMNPYGSCDKCERR